MAVTFKTTSNKQINIFPYVSTFQYEIMQFKPAVFEDIKTEEFFKKLFNEGKEEDISTKIMQGKLDTYRDLFLTNDNTQIGLKSEPLNLYNNIIITQVFEFILKNRIHELKTVNTNTLFILPNVISNNVTLNLNSLLKSNTKTFYADLFDRTKPNDNI